MDLQAALDSLPVIHAVALRLRMAGATDEAIAAQVHVDSSEVSEVLVAANRMLVALLRDERADWEGTGHGS